jgi:hypothetical protein
MGRFSVFVQQLNEKRLIEVDVGAGYIQIHAGEIIQRGDEWQVATAAVGSPWTALPPSSWGRKIPRDKFIPTLYRRKKVVVEKAPVVSAPKPASPAPVERPSYNLRP